MHTVYIYVYVNSLSLGKEKEPALPWRYQGTPQDQRETTRSPTPQAGAFWLFYGVFHGV